MSSTIIMHVENKEQEDALTAVAKALKINFEVEKRSQYNPEFVAKIKESRRQVSLGQTVRLDLDDIWKE